MSSFANYNDISQHYDITRSATGIEVILGCLMQPAASLSGLSVLDAGCGTGNYSLALADRVARIDAVDMSEGMLAVARAKLSTDIAGGKVRLHQGSILELPFAEESFDAVMVNQVLHHLPADPARPFRTLGRAFEEFERVLKPGGALLLNTCLIHQLREAFWYYHLVPGHADRVARLFPSDAELLALLRRAGLQHHGRYVPADAVLLGEAHFDETGPLRKPWRDGDSAWSLVSEDEVTRMIDLVESMRRDGSLRSFRVDADARRPQVGQITILHCRKAASPPF